MMKSDVFASECSACAALCCMALAFDEGDSFGFDKAAGVSCPMLDAEGRCKIHDRLTEEGFSGCAAYGCQGAGPAATRLFGGRSWRQDPGLVQPMIDAFARLREIHDLAAQLEASAEMSIPMRLHQRASALMSRLMPADGWTRETLAAFDLIGARAVFRTLINDIRAAVGRSARVGGNNA